MISLTISLCIILLRPEKNFISKTQSFVKKYTLSACDRKHMFYNCVYEGCEEELNIWLKTVMQWGEFKSIQDCTQYTIYCLAWLIHHTFTICLGSFSAQSLLHRFHFIVWLPYVADAVQLQCHGAGSDQVPGSRSMSDQLIYDPEISGGLQNHWQVPGMLTV